MGKSYQGAYGNYTGKVGNVIARKSNGRTVLAIYQPVVKNPKTEEQTNQRSKFGMLSKFASHIGAFISEGFKESGVNTTAYNRFIKKNFEDGIGGSFPDFELLYNKIKVSNGNLLLPYSPSALADSGAINVSWTNNGGEGNAKNDDKAMILVYNSAKQVAVFKLSGAARSERQDNLTCPTTWAGDSVDVWLAMVSADGELHSESAYLGNYSL